ncbi:MAG: glutamine--fructose-6-phosphate transaminase (isomerizing) [Chlamydiae bacterium]|nr:glutamine--fructose-6-phosphate transaminase (isomerizing) [Chlamydiota bacterium]
MCGIFGYVAHKKTNAVEECLKGLQALEYRGYDSAGLAGIKQGKIHFYKRVGKVRNLKELVFEEEVALEIGIAHTRWATHGGLTEQNAHPQLDSSHSLALIHNGIIENYQEIRFNLMNLGKEFVSETDTEVISQLLAYEYTDFAFIPSLVRTLEQLEGSFAIACIHKDFPDAIFASARDCPLIIAKCKKTDDIFISSDANALSRQDMELIFLHDGEIAQISAGIITLYDKKGLIIQKAFESISLCSKSSSKEGFEHFMLKEIFDQPLSLSQVIKNRFDSHTAKVQIHECKDLGQIEHIRLIGCGTSYHAGLLVSSIFEEMLQIETSAEIASEFRYKDPILRKNSLVIAISQSGETADTLAALRLAKSKGAKTLGFGNVMHSSLFREADLFIDLKAGPEVSVCSTKAFTSQIASLLLFALYLKQTIKGVDVALDTTFFHHLESLSGIVTDVLQQKDLIRSFAEKYADYENFFFIGRNLMYPTSMEAALKLKEISYINATAYPAGELKHGPIALIDETIPTIAFLGNEKTLSKTFSNLTEIQARKGKILALSPRHFTKITTITNDVIWLQNDLPDFFSAIPYSVAAQLLAYYIAKKRGKEIDQPRNLAKAVTVE